MKRIFLALAVIIVLLTATTLCYGEDMPESKLRLFYDGNTYELINPVLSKDNEYYFNAQELSSKLGMQMEVKASEVIIEFNDTKKTFSIDAYKTPSYSSGVVHSSPENIDSELYFPFSMLKSAYKMIIKYSEDNKAVYIFSENAQAYDYRNLTYDYGLPAASGFRVYTGESENNFQEHTVSFVHKNSKLSAIITCDRLDEISLNNMRKYLNDFTSPDNDIFQKFVEYKMSYFSAMQDYYKRDFLYGISSPESDDANMKVIGEYKEKLYGMESDIVIYNVIKNEKLLAKEETHLNITIPVYSNMTVYSINFAIPRGYLDASNSKEIMNFIKSLKVSNLSEQKNTLTVFHDLKAIHSANQGIYPEMNQPSAIAYSLLQNNNGGYQISYPSTFVPFRQNNLVRSFDYKSFKIDSNKFISISSRQIPEEKTAIKQTISLIKNYYGKKISNIDEGISIIGDKAFTYIKYSVSEGSGKVNVLDYFFVSDFRLINIRLHSTNTLPDERLLNEFTKILSSLKVISAPSAQETSLLAFSQLLNKEEGYSLLCPTDWNITEIDNNDVNYDSYSIKTSAYSGPIEITVNEGELKSGLSYIDILKYVTGTDTTELNRYFKKYSVPYINRIYQTLDFGYHQENNALYLYKLVNYLDSSNRGKIGYSVDIIKDRKIYSLFISVSDYMTVDGKVFDKQLGSAINLIANSFVIEDTKESKQRKLSGETRNRKVVFIESFLKKTSGKNLRVNFTECLDSEKNLIVYAGNNQEDLIYWVKADYENKSAEVLQNIEVNDLFNSMSDRLKSIYSDKTIEEIKLFKDSMSIEIRYKDETIKPAVKRQYQITGYIRENSLAWKLDRSDYSNAIKNDCKEFIQSLLAYKANIYFDPDLDFSELSELREKGGDLYIPVFAEFKELSGYFVLKVSPYNDKVTLDSYTPLELIHDRINKLYAVPQSDYTLFNIGLTENDRFEFQVFLASKYRISYKLSKLKVSINPNSKELELN